MAGDTPKRATQKETAGSERWSFIPYFVERMFGVVESFVERITQLVEERTHGLVQYVLHRLFGLLLLGVGIVFLLSGTADVINGLSRFPGIGQLVVGTFVLIVTGTVMFFTRRRA